jgi:hypothetical protein
MCQNQQRSYDLQNWFGYENESFNAEFMWSSKLVEWMQISIQNYKTATFSHAYQHNNIRVWIFPEISFEGFSVIKTLNPQHQLTF